MGPSGSGKSTLMHCLAGLDSVSRGEVYVGDTRVTGLGDAGLTRLRRDKIGFIFQQFNLLPTLTAEENILLPLSIAGRKPDPEWYRTVIETVRLGDRLGHRPSQLSGGQQQRVACARALVARPEVIFADEPTGNLDSRSGADVLRLPARLGADARPDHRDGHPRPGGRLVRRPRPVPRRRRRGRRDPRTRPPTRCSTACAPSTPSTKARRGAGPKVAAAANLESRGTTDPTGRTPHPGPSPTAGGPPHRTNDNPRGGGGSAGRGNPGDPTARLADGPTSDVSQTVRVFPADNAPTATLTSTAPSTLTAIPQPSTPAKAPNPAPTQANPNGTRPAGDATQATVPGQPKPTAPASRGTGTIQSHEVAPSDPTAPTTPAAQRPATIHPHDVATPDPAHADNASRPAPDNDPAARRGAADPTAQTPAAQGPTTIQAHDVTTPNPTTQTTPAAQRPTTIQPRDMAPSDPTAQTTRADSDTAEKPGAPAPRQTTRATRQQRHTPLTPRRVRPDPGAPDASGQAAGAAEETPAGAESGERRAGTPARRRAAAQRPAATRPPKGRPRKRSSPLDQPEPNRKAADGPAEPTDGAPVDDAAQPRKAATRATPGTSAAAKRASKPRDAGPAGTAHESTVDDTK